MNEKVQPPDDPGKRLLGLTPEARTETEREINRLDLEIAKMMPGGFISNRDRLQKGALLAVLLRLKKEAEERLANDTGEATEPSPKITGREQQKTKVKKSVKASSRNDPEVAKRRALVKANRDLSAREMCDLFDRSGVPLPGKWKAAGGPQTWAKAFFGAHRGQVGVIISKDKKHS